MPTAEEFDEFYVQSRRRLLLQAFALTGDLGAARSAVRDAYVAARHHWSKVGRMSGPEDWVRPRAWAAAQRRHGARPWHKEKGLGEDQAAVLEALGQLSDGERKVLVLNHLAAVPMDGIGREIGVSRERVEQDLQSATAATALALDIDSTGVRAALERLEPALEGVRLPRAPAIRRSGVRRRRWHAVGATLALVAVTFGAGALVLDEPGGAVDEGSSTVAQSELVPRSMLLDAAAAREVAPARRWRLVATTDNTAGDGINSLCQGRRFADERGLGTWVRTLRSGEPGGRQPQRVMTQTVEISDTEKAANHAYDTTVGWYAGCTQARIQLLRAYSVTGVGDEAQLLMLRVPGRAQRSYFVGVSRSGELTVSTLLETRGGPAPGVDRMVDLLAEAVRGLCDSRVAGACVTEPHPSPVLPPPSGEGRGMLAVADLPPLPGVPEPWVGTDPKPATPAAAATTCDRANFAAAGAQTPRSRTFLIPESRLPARFGMTQTVGRFPSVGKAHAFVGNVERALRVCSDKFLATKVTVAKVVPHAYRGSEFALWRVQNQVSKDERTVAFWMGVARVGRDVMQVTFAPVQGADVDEQTFQALVTRARDRLYELQSPGHVG